MQGGVCCMGSGRAAQKRADEVVLRKLRQEGKYPIYYLAKNHLKTMIQEVKDLRVAFVPMGQHPRPNAKAAEACATRYRNDPAAWPKAVPSFELWASATCYDANKTDGGDTFQKMMKYLLVDSPNGEGDQVKPEA